GAARAHGGDAVDELGLAHRPHRGGTVGAVAGGAFDEHRLRDVVAAARVGKQIVQQITMAREVPQVMMRVDDLERGLDDVLAVEREPFFLDARAARDGGFFLGLFVHGPLPARSLTRMEPPRKPGYAVGRISGRWAA